MSDRLDVRKTYKLLVNGAFPRSESGRSYEVTRASGEFLANVAQGSRKDVRDAVVAARAAQPKWWAQSAYNRGQVIYRLAEMAESRRDEFAEHVALARGSKPRPHARAWREPIDRIVWYAGWTDKVAQVLGSSNPVAGPFFNFSCPVPSGVVAVVADQDSSLEAFVDAVLAPVCVGNAVVAVASERRPTPAVLLGEMTATSDFPAGRAQRRDRLHGRARPDARLARGRRRNRPGGRRRGLRGRTGARWPPDRSSGCCEPGRARRRSSDCARSSRRPPSGTRSASSDEPLRTRRARRRRTSRATAASTLRRRGRARLGLEGGRRRAGRADSVVDDDVAAAASSAPTVAGHSGADPLADVGGPNVALIAGRVHLYEGHSAHEVVHPVRTVDRGRRDEGCPHQRQRRTRSGVAPGQRGGHSRPPQLHRDLAAWRAPSPPEGYGARFVDLTDLYSARPARAGARGRARLCAKASTWGCADPTTRRPPRSTWRGDAGRVPGGDVDRARGDRRAPPRRRRPRAVVSCPTSRPAWSAAPLNHHEVLEAGQAAAASLGALLSRRAARAVNEDTPPTGRAWIALDPDDDGPRARCRRCSTAGDETNSSGASPRR